MRVYYAKATYDNKEIAAVNKVLKKGWLSTGDIGKFDGDFLKITDFALSSEASEVVL